MAWTQADIDALKAAIAGGARSVTFGDRTVVYHSLEEQLKALAVMETSVNAATRSTYRVAATSKGV